MEITEKTDLPLTCVRCGRKIPIRNIFGLRDGNGFCLECFIGGGFCSSIFDHSYKPHETIFAHLSTENGSKKGKLLYLGIELEIEHRSLDLMRYAFELQKQYPIYVKHDGSLQRGLEIVSYPQTSKYHQKIFKWYELLEKLRKDKFTSYDNGRCGLHIHVNRDYFDRKDEILKVVMFYYKCFDKVRQFSKRQRIDYCKKWEASLINEVNARRGKVALAYHNEDRNVCINTQNRDTIEFRIYRGTLNYDRFLSTILFTDSICNFVRLYPTSFFLNRKHVSCNLWDEFMGYIRKEDRYEFLGHYLREHKLNEANNTKLFIPAYEDYATKKLKPIIEIRDAGLVSLASGSGLEQYILPSLSYEFIEEDYANIDFKNADNYLVYLSNNLPKWIVPKAIVRLKLRKQTGIPSTKIAKIIYMFLRIPEYCLRITDSEGRTYKEVKNMAEFFSEVIPDTSYPGITTTRMYEVLSDFIRNNIFRYEIIRSDVTHVYNRM